jgi:hypothetical protein
MTALSLCFALALSAILQAGPVTRVDAARAVERARYAFVIGATKPFDDVYPRAVFETRVQRELAEEQVLADVFALRPSAAQLADEYERIEKTTKAPEQWQAIKHALGNDRRLIEDVFCRPALVSRTLRARFAFDPRIHNDTHQQARTARAAFLERASASGAVQLSLPRRSTDREVASVLEAQLRRPGDVTTILEHADRFDVYRLLAITTDTWKLDMVRVQKQAFDRWFETNRARLGPRG